MLKHILANSAAIALGAYLIPGVVITGGMTTAGLLNLALVVITLGLVNIFIKPILSILTLPITILTLGLFSVVLHAGMILLVDWLLSGFSVASFVTALAFALFLSFMQPLLHKLS
jgi:putative membrane protein